MTASIRIHGFYVALLIYWVDFLAMHNSYVLFMYLIYWLMIITDYYYLLCICHSVGIIERITQWNEKKKWGLT